MLDENIHSFTVLFQSESPFNGLATYVCNKHSISNTHYSIEHDYEFITDFDHWSAHVYSNKLCFCRDQFPDCNLNLGSKCRTHIYQRCNV